VTSFESDFSSEIVNVVKAAAAGVVLPSAASAAAAALFSADSLPAGLMLKIGNRKITRPVKFFEHYQKRCYNNEVPDIEVPDIEVRTLRSQTLRSR
jgi:hypothetical protein